MEAKDSFTLSWCEKHKNWWVTNCPDCMVDFNEIEIKKAGMEEVVGWINTHARDSYAGRPLVPDWTAFKHDDWQAKLEEWGL